jgi:peptide chain release factor 1
MDLKLTKEMADRRAVRQNLVKTADRSEKIRTYNYAQVRSSVILKHVSVLKIQHWQDRVTDHRIGLSVKNLEHVMEGEGMIDIIERLRRDYHETLTKEVLEE